MINCSYVLRACNGHIAKAMVKLRLNDNSSMKLWKAFSSALSEYNDEKALEIKEHGSQVLDFDSPKSDD